MRTDGMRILIVEDEMDIRAILKEGLESHLACTVDTAADRAAVEMARRCGIRELILLRRRA